MIVAHPGEILDKKKFLFVSLDGLIADIAWQVVKEGHEVKLFCEAVSEREIADGFVRGFKSRRPD